jgi:hypothetical protein
MNAQTDFLTDKQQDDWVSERQKMIYLIQGLQEELDKTHTELEEYDASYQRLRALIKTLRFKLKHIAQRWFIHGIGIGFIGGYLFGKVFD